jgi:integrase
MSYTRVWIKRGTKGGRHRYVTVTTPEQRATIGFVRRLTPGLQDCLVPKDELKYSRWRQRVYKELRAVGIFRASGSTFHDLRRTFADRELKRLIGKGHTPEQAAKIVSKELGHNRVEILKAYTNIVSGERANHASRPHPPQREGDEFRKP